MCLCPHACVKILVVWQALAAVENAVKEAQTRYDEATDRAEKKTAEVRRTGLLKMTEQVCMYACACLQCTYGLISDQLESRYCA
jgi:hypothetical protein